MVHGAGGAAAASTGRAGCSSSGNRVLTIAEELLTRQGNRNAAGTVQLEQVETEPKPGIR
jgi:hypothetical protein